MMTVLEIDRWKRQDKCEERKVKILNKWFRCGHERLGPQCTDCMSWWWTRRLQEHWRKKPAFADTNLLGQHVSQIKTAHYVPRFIHMGLFSAGRLFDETSFAALRNGGSGFISFLLLLSKTEIVKLTGSILRWIYNNNIKNNNKRTHDP